MEMATLDGMAVRAIDVGYGNVKFSLSHTEARGPIECDIFPSRSPVASDKGLAAGMLKGRDTVIIQVNGTDYEVGKDVAYAQGHNDISSNLDKDFCLSDVYIARARGALHYMKGLNKHGVPYLSGNTIALLVLGLPVSSFRNVTMRTKMMSILQGKHELVKGEFITIDRVVVLPQPLGSFFDFSFGNSLYDQMRDQINLVIDVGFHTFDWILNSGLTPIDTRSDSVNRGMSAVMTAIIDAMIKGEEWEGAEPAQLIRMLDDNLRKGGPLIIYNHPIDLNKYLSAGRGVINEAVSALKNSVGDGADINNIIIAGGGANLYFDAVQEKFPRHKIAVMDAPVYANVRGFQLAGERQLIGLIRKQRKDSLSS